MTAKSKVAVCIAVTLVVIAATYAIRRHRQQVRMAEQYRENLRLAGNGDAEAQDRLGNDYFYGVGFSQSFAEAMTWYRKGAALGDAHSEFALGYIYATGTGVAQDYTQAMKWYRDAANGGYSGAADAIGSMYFYGQGTAKDTSAALAWYRRAAEGGDVWSEEFLGSRYFYGRDEMQSNDEAVGWFRRAADKGYAPAEYDLGYMYYHGYGMPRSAWQSRTWYRRAAAQGDAKALRVVSEGWSTFTNSIVILKLTGGLLLLIPFRIWARGTSRTVDRLQRTNMASGTLCLLLAALGWYGYPHQKIWRLLFVPMFLRQFTRSWKLHYSCC